MKKFLTKGKARYFASWKYKGRGRPSKIAYNIASDLLKKSLRKGQVGVFNGVGFYKSVPKEQ